jgi:hypothetical protein
MTATAGQVHKSSLNNEKKEENTTTDEGGAKDNEEWKYYVYIITHNEHYDVFKFGFSGQKLYELYQPYRRVISESYLIRVVYLKDKKVSLEVLLTCTIIDTSYDQLTNNMYRLQWT